jgi:hypothetical protein
MSMSITINYDDLDGIVKDIGLLLDLLQDSDDHLILNEGWFGNPMNSIKGIPKRPRPMLDLLTDILDEPDDTITVVNGLSWYRVSEEHPIYLVLPKQDTADPAVIGVGMASAYKKEGNNNGVTITPYLYFPLFSLSSTQNPAFVLGQTGNPIKIGGEVTMDKALTVQGKQLKTLTIDSSIYLDGTLPHLSVDFHLPNMSFPDLNSLLIFPDISDIFNELLQFPLISDWLKISFNIKVPQLNLGELFAQLKFLTPDFKFDLPDLEKLLPLKLPDFENLLFNALDFILGELQNFPVIDLGDLGGIYIDVKNGLYGIRLQLKDIPLTKTKNKTPQTPVKPKMLLQLGKWFTGEADDGSDSWLKGAYKAYDSKSDKPGVAFYFLTKSNDTITFTPRVELVSIGLDYVSGDKNPLVNIHGVQLGGFEARSYLFIDLENAANNKYGGGMRLDNMALPLGGQFGKVGGNNPVAANLLASGSGSENGNNAPKGKTNAVNPEFSISFSYVDQLHVQLYGPDGSETDTVWFPVQKHLGPLDCRKIGVGWQDEGYMLTLQFDGSVSLAALSVDLENLSIGIPVTTPTDYGSYKLGLDGLDVEYKGGPVEITGGLLKNENVTAPAVPPSYDGQIFIKVENLAICGLGSYAALKGGGTSFFAFAVLDYPLGGPSFFFITGVAAGFGYNRSLKIPKQNQVQDFPLVAAMTDPAAIGGENPTPGQVLQKLDDWITPTRGEYWLAAGINFTSFDIVNSNALVAMEFDKKFEVLILGLSKIKLPTEGDHIYVYAELMLELVLIPDDGVFSAAAVLSPNSYVIDPACHLTGGFAFMLWFGDNPHAGDFVVTLGGYHPAFTPPPWYPQEPRLGFNWPVSDNISIKGDAYFALTPSAGMAGGSLEAQYHSGNLKAWFTAYADVLVYWKPFYFIADIGVSIGASYRVNVLFGHVTLKVELGASLELWGPPTGGQAHVHWYIISFTVGFGAAKSGPQSVTWDTFKQMLPQKQSQDDPQAQTRHMVAADVEDPAAQDPYIHIIPGSGLLKKRSDGSWIIRPSVFSFSIGYSIPAISHSFCGTSIDTLNKNIGIRPMGIKQLTTSTYTITIKDSQGHEITDWDYTPDCRNEPEAMWGTDDTLSADAKLVDNCTMGIKDIKLQPHSEPNGPPEFPMKDVFDYYILDPDKDYLPLDPKAQPPDNTPQSGDSLTAINKINSQTVATKRTDLFNALVGLGLNPGINGDLTNMGKYPGFDLEAAPMMGTPVKETGLDSRAKRPGMWKRLKAAILRWLS